MDVERLGGKALVLHTDVSSAEHVEAAAQAVEQELGPHRYLGEQRYGVGLSPFKQMTADEFRRVTEVTYLGYVHGTMSALKRMLPRDRGAIVQVGSALAYRGIPLQSAYSGAKHAIQGFTESVRAELLHDKSNVWLTMVQMPALNTPQFNWIKSRMPRKPRPVPPIFQPEVAAEAIYWAAHHRRRELYVGLSSLIVIWGNKLAPYLGDRYLAGSGYDSQQYDGAPEPDRPDNLWEPVVGDWGAHGDFDSQAKSTSAQSWADTHRGVIAVAGAGLAAGSVGLGGFLGALLRRNKPQRRAKR